MKCTKSLEKNCTFVMRWFEKNYVKLNTDKCHVISGYKNKLVSTNTGENTIWESSNIKFIGIAIDGNISKLCSEANRSSSALCRMVKFFCFD